MTYKSAYELACKVDWEGGLAEAILGYGIRADDLPEGTPQEIRDAWLRIEMTAPDIQLVSDWLDTT